MLLDKDGLKLAKFDPVLASVLGDSKGEEGCKVLAETLIHRRGQVQLRDWLYCLAKAPGTWLRKRLIDAPGQSPDRFVTGIEGGIDDDDEPKGMAPDQLTSETVAPAIMVFLEAAERKTDGAAGRPITDAILTIALLETLDEDLKGLLIKWASPDGFKRFFTQLSAEVTRPSEEIPIFNVRVQPDDIVKPKELAAAIQSASNGLVKYVASKMPADLLEEVASEESTRSPQKADMAAGLDRLLEDKDLFDAAKAAGAALGDKAAALLSRKPEGPALAVTNRLLLNLAFKGLVEPCKINQTVFDQRGRQFCKRLREDCASMGCRQITIRHVLYSLLGNESGLLPVGLAIRGVDVKKEPHAALSRELARPGKKRNDAIEVTRDDIFPSVEQLFKDSYNAARERGAKAIGEFDIGRTFVLKYSSELARLFTNSSPLDLTGLKSYVDTADVEAEEDSLKPIHRLSIKEIETQIKGRVLGQEAAVDRVLPWIKRLRFGLPRDGRPAGVFLFLGPTGTGKTQLAKELARHVFGDENMMLFMEMGQFQSKESMNMFIGAPPGYVGYGEGKLTNGLRDKPECVVLFDEIEKAFTQVFDTLLRFADEGFISDPAGPVRDGRKCIIVMTTNAGQTWLRGHLKENPSARQNPEVLSSQLFDEAMKEMQKNGFRPEFLGRVDERISFLPFTLETCRKIVDSVLARELDKFKQHGAITIEVPTDVRDVLAQKAYDRSIDEGARGAPRAVNEWIVTPAIDMLSARETEADGPVHLIASVSGLEKVKLELV